MSEGVKVFTQTRRRPAPPPVLPRRRRPRQWYPHGTAEAHQGSPDAAGLAHGAEVVKGLFSDFPKRGARGYVANGEPVRRKRWIIRASREGRPDRPSYESTAPPDIRLWGWRQKSAVGAMAKSLPLVVRADPVPTPTLTWAQSFLLHV